MESTEIIEALSALAQPTRLEAFRLMMAAEPDGLAAGKLARKLAVPQNTLSSHLAILAQAGLVHGERQGRSIIYRADISRMNAIVMFLLQDCCGGRPEICQPVFDMLRPCCAAGPDRQSLSVREARP